jgi:hypothetical protein
VPDHGTFVAEYVAQSETLRLGPGRAGVAWVRLRNAGTATWRRDGAAPVRLGTDRPADAPALLDPAESWPGPGRLARLSEPAVAPGQIGTFEVLLRAPRAPGRYRQPVRPVAEGAAWFNQLDLEVGVDVVVPTAEPLHHLAAALVQDMPRLVVPAGRLGRLSLRLRNVGRARWGDLAPPVVLLGTDEPFDRASERFDEATWVSANRLARMPRAVLPGEEVEVPVTLRAPTDPGRYEERVRLVAEEVGWFGPGLTLVVIVP